MSYSKLQTDIVIIGDGIAALSLAYLAARNELKCVILGKNILGATNAATGFLAPRPDYLLHDREMVRRTAYECTRWTRIFSPQIIKAEHFLIPIGPELPKSVGKFEALLEFYDQETKVRMGSLPSGYFKIDRAALERIEPNIKKNHFDGALALWELTVDPAVLIEKMNEAVAGMGVVKINIMEMFGCEEAGNRISDVIFMDTRGEIIRINQPRVVVNAAGPWIPDVCKSFGMSLPMELKIGVQAKVPGQYLKSGIITFGPDKKYIVCLQKEGYVQVGPTNGTEDIESLRDVFAGLIENPVPEVSFLKSGNRVKPFVADTQRPVIWNHKSPENFYSVHPGKMVLALLAADELLAQINKDGWTKRAVNMPNRTYALKGETRRLSSLKVRWLAIKSFAALAAYYLEFLYKLKTP